MSVDSIDTLERGALAGEGDAAAKLGLCYLTGRNVAANPARGLVLIEQAARAGDPGGTYLAATIASTAFWRPRNWEAAFDYLLQAAERGHEVGQAALRILAAGPSGAIDDGCDWGRMRGDIDFAAWVTPPEARLVREAPRIGVIEKFQHPRAPQVMPAGVEDEPYVGNP